MMERIVRGRARRWGVLSIRLALLADGPAGRQRDARLAIRYERRVEMHHAFLTLGCALICFNHVPLADGPCKALLGGIHSCMQRERHVLHRDYGLQRRNVMRRFNAVVTVRPGVGLVRGHRFTHRPLPPLDVEARQLIAAKQLGCAVNRLACGQ